LLLYFTNWTLEITTIMILMTILCSLDTKIEQSQQKLAITHILFETSLFMNIVVLIVYWGLLH